MKASDILLNEDPMELYCDVLVLYFQVGSAMGDCDLHRMLSAALDSSDPEELQKALQRFEALPKDLKERVFVINSSSDFSENLEEDEENVADSGKSMKSA